MTDNRLREIIERAGSWTSAYVDGDGPRPRVEEESRERAVGDRLLEIGAPAEDADAIAQALGERRGVASPSARIVLASAGEVVLDESFSGARRGPERLVHGPLPLIVPLLRHESDDTRYLVVEASRDSADIRLETATRGTSSRTQVEGDSDDITKVQAGGWSHANFQRYAESTWKRNQAEVAETVREIVRESRPVFVAVAGDVRARQLLIEELGDLEHTQIVEAGAHTHADGADSAKLDDAIASALEDHARDRIQRIRDGALADNGSAGAEGIPAVLAALQQARVEAVVLDNRMLDADEELLALDAAPWVASDESEMLDANLICRTSAAEALARAAVLTDAELVIEEEPASAEDAPREERPVREPLASLRWPDPDDATEGA